MFMPPSEGQFVAYLYAVFPDRTRRKLDDIHGFLSRRVKRERPEVFFHLDHSLIFIGKEDIDGKEHEKHVQGDPFFFFAGEKERFVLYPP